MLFFKFLIYSILFINTLSNESGNDAAFRPPLRIPVLLSSNFGELRIDHFHSGIDIKTQGETGKEVVAAADGFVYRISVSPGGFGKALYVKHHSGYSTVYAHLDRFTPEIEEYVKAQQYEKQSFLVTLFPERDKFRVKQGQLIAYSGNSGSSGGPHLHYEIRESDSERPLNPLLFNTGASDNISPIFDRIAIYPLSDQAFINNHRSPVRIPVKAIDGRYTAAIEKEIVISGQAGFGIKAYDLISGSPNRCAVYSIELQIDSTCIYKYVMDKFAFTESRYVNSHIDYETFMRDNVYYERAYVLPNDKLENYSNLVNRGIYNFNDERKHNIRFIIKDVKGNKSSVSFSVRSTAKKPAAVMTAAHDGRLMPFGKSNKFSENNISLTIPSGALYDTLYFSYRKNPGTPVMLSDLHSVHNDRTPVQKAMTLQIKPTKIVHGKESKMLVVQLNDNLSKKPFVSTWTDDGYLKADIMAFGNFFVGIDTVAPSISAPGLTPGINLSGRNEMKIRISDDFSGIKSYEPTIDGKWALFEYDPKTSAIYYHFDSKYITKGTKHSLSLKVTDNTDNESWYSLDFTW